MWEQDVISHTFRVKPLLWLSSDSVEVKTGFGRRKEELSQRLNNTFTEKQLDEGYSHHQWLYSEQQDLVGQRYATAEIKEAMANLPHVKVFRMSIGNALMFRSDYLNQAFKESLHCPFDDDQQEGVP